MAEKHRFPLDLPSAKRRTYEIYLELVPVQLKAFPGAVALVRACRQAGLRLAVASSADEVKIVANLRQIGLPPDTWDAVVTGDDVVSKKPAPDIFLSAAAKLGLAAGAVRRSGGCGERGAGRQGCGHALRGCVADFSGHTIAGRGFGAAGHRRSVPGRFERRDGKHRQRCAIPLDGTLIFLCSLVKGVDLLGVLARLCGFGPAGLRWARAT